MVQRRPRGTTAVSIDVVAVVREGYVADAERMVEAKDGSGIGDLVEPLGAEEGGDRSGAKRVATEVVGGAVELTPNVLRG